jgi:hypothetical protein
LVGELLLRQLINLEDMERGNDIEYEGPPHNKAKAFRYFMEYRILQGSPFTNNGIEETI